ncbi:class I adenylate-forming enzyme family protein [Rhodococcoides kyotonense]|uniref:Acyl-CoA synthetase (AMP-forming)/AMP-acid ligase II n=1 Tax=Rhodococcoides kyotonense TaxID=398843 RepID=A0A239K1R7_9NOCA|nr:AMP-binding protein [Rhodococcus kyotonensis]SNT11698.1 Acyl-CoA synthetase (AMP-forming)/AMP-acid ligase II [Rhodococcus kyotonensis]
MTQQDSFDVTTLRGRRADRRWNRLAVGDILERVRSSAPDKLALVAREGACASARFRRMTYREADEAANQVAHALLDRGLNPGDRVLLYCDNSIEAIVLMFGVAKAGMVAVPVNPLLAPDVLRWVIGHVDVAFAVVDGEYIERVNGDLDEAGVGIGVVIPVGGQGLGGVDTFDAWISRYSVEPPEIEVHADDIWSLLFTSGTTAMPKASMTSHTYSYMAGFSYAMSLTRGLKFETNFVMCTFLPIVFHCGHNSTLLPALLSGGTMVLGRRPDPRGLADAITEHGVTAVWAGSPAWVQALADAALDDPTNLDLSTLTVAMFSWGAMNPTMENDLRRACGTQVALLEVFGQTESMSCFRFWPEMHPSKFAQTFDGVNYVGVPNPMLGADIVDIDGVSLRGKASVPGEAVYRSPVITAGYYRDEESTREAFRDGWFHSGDSCMYDDDGLQIMVDRFKDIVKSGGENVSSLRVEGVLAAHPDVVRAAVIGLPDDKWGERVTGVVTVKAGVIPDAASLIAYARERLASYEAPKQIVVVDAMPETVGGKILKYKLRQRLSGAGNAGKSGSESGDDDLRGVGGAIDRIHGDAT